jgi:hypothetical protein
MKRKKKITKKNPFPFYSKVSGGAATYRPDRKAGPKVAAKADAEPSKPNAPNAPAGGGVEQHFTGDVAIPRPRAFKKGGIAKRQFGGPLRPPADVPPPPPPRFEPARKRGAPLRSESTENARAESRLRRNISGFDALVNPGKKRIREVQEDAQTTQETGPYGYKRGGVLSAAQRQSLPKSSFALPGKGEGPKGAGAGSYPIPDASHARNALARVSQHGSSAEKAKVRAKVAAKFPGIGQK